MNGRKARIAFIGCGGHATRSLYPCIHEIPIVDLVAVCDLKEELARRNARLFGARRWYTDMFEMLEKEKPDGVLVIGDPHMQFEVGSKVLEVGYPIFVEKPSAIDSNKARQLAELADSKGLFGQVAFMKRFAYAYRIAKKLVESEEFGGVHLIDVKFSQGPYPRIWGLESASKSFLIGQAIHLFDLVRFFGGDVEKVHAFYTEISPEQFGYTVNLRFKSGAIGLMNLNSMDMREPWRDFDERLNVSGDRNMVEVRDMIYLRYQSREDWVEPPEGTGKPKLIWEPTGPALPSRGKILGYTGEIEHFARCLLEGRKPSPDLWDSYEALRLAEAVWESVQTGKIVEIR